MDYLISPPELASRSAGLRSSRKIRRVDLSFYFLLKGQKVKKTALRAKSYSLYLLTPF